MYCMVDILILESEVAPLRAQCKLTKFDQREINSNENITLLSEIATTKLSEMSQMIEIGDWRKGWYLNYYFKSLKSQWTVHI